PKGLLRVSLPGPLARQRVLPHLPAFLQKYPDIELHLEETDRFVDLVREGIDCVLRVGKLQNSDMIARHLGVLEEITVASTDYLERRGIPDHPATLMAEGQRMVGFHSSATGALLPLVFV